MTYSQILLILASGLGVIHGWTLSIFLWFYQKGNRKANRWLSALLLVLSLRVGKSVFLEFTENLDVKIVFTGLSLMLCLGPIFYFFTRQYTEPNFRFKSADWLHFVPTIIGFGIGLGLNDEWMDTLPSIFFLLLFLIYYGHFLGYLLVSWRRFREVASNTVKYPLWSWLFYGLLVVWFAYVLNLFDDIIPYVIGPILYTLVAYGISFIVIRNAYLSTPNEKYKTTPVSDHQIEQVFEKAKAWLLAEEKFKNGNLNLKLLSEALKVTPQILSLVINKQTKGNFNHFINSFRINAAKNLLADEKSNHYTIAAIAYEVGFNSISSFNTAFKKQEGSTPTHYRRSFSK